MGCERCSCWRCSAQLVLNWLRLDVASSVVPNRWLLRMAESVYLAAVGTQLALVLLAAPAVTAGSICLDRARGTLLHMLMTDLSNAEIVLGKLAARLIPVLSLLLCTIPMVMLLSLVGGVDAGALLGGLVVSASLAILGCSLAMCLSLWSGKTQKRFWVRTRCGVSGCSRGRC